MPPLAAFHIPAGRRSAQILGALRRAGYRTEPPVASRGEALYFDTQGGALFDAGERLCFTGGGWRLEREGALPMDSGEAGSAQAVAVAATVAERTRGARLLPLARVRWRGRAFALEGPGESRFVGAFLRRSCALPDGEWGGESPVLEVSQTGGAPQELDRLSAVLRGVAHLPPAPGDALTAALGALGRALPGAPLPQGLRVGAQDLMCTAGRKVLGQQAYRMRANADGAAQDLDPEYVHDLRVATRRARSALRLFAPALGPRRCESLRLELAWAARLSSPVRDLDVFLEALPAHLDRAGVGAESRLWLARWLGARRVEAQEALASGLRSARYARLQARLERFAASPPPRLPRGAAALAVSQAAPALVERAAKGVRSAGRAVGEPPGPGALHALRIRFKRLRYTCEFFREALGERAEAYLKLLVAVQDCLGAHQDAAAAEALLREAAEQAGSGAGAPQRLMDLGALLQVQRDEALSCRAAFGPLWKSFRKRARPRGAS